mmetsp:Transcript_11169/g.19394  ORF Transcript_11169/g.19394 Transcript_11169/m.19394 type:complete len:474 (+) Transcript_11169:746-2167(+)
MQSMSPHMPRHTRLRSVAMKIPRRLTAKNMWRGIKPKALHLGSLSESGVVQDRLACRQKKPNLRRNSSSDSLWESTGTETPEKPGNCTPPQGGSSDNKQLKDEQLQSTGYVGQNTDATALWTPSPARRDDLTSETPLKRPGEKEAIGISANHVGACNEKAMVLQWTGAQRVAVETAAAVASTQKAQEQIMLAVVRNAAPRDSVNAVVDAATLSTIQKGAVAVADFQEEETGKAAGAAAKRLAKEKSVTVDASRRGVAEALVQSNIQQKAVTEASTVSFCVVAAALEEDEQEITAESATKELVKEGASTEAMTPVTCDAKAAIEEEEERSAASAKRLAEKKEIANDTTRAIVADAVAQKAVEGRQAAEAAVEVAADLKFKCKEAAPTACTQEIYEQDTYVQESPSDVHVQDQDVFNCLPKDAIKSGNGQDSGHDVLPTPTHQRYPGKPILPTEGSCSSTGTCPIFFSMLDSALD